jgi:hypothetical protein
MRMMHACVCHAHSTMRPAEHSSQECSNALNQVLFAKLLEVFLSINSFWPALQVCMVLRLEAEELTQYTDDLDADQKRDLLAALLHSLDAVLPFLRQVQPQRPRPSLSSMGKAFQGRKKLWPFFGDSSPSLCDMVPAHACAPCTNIIVPCCMPRGACRAGLMD